jgi:hypothetical protein
MPGRKERNSLKDLFHDYTLVLELNPPGIFGAADESSLVLPTPSGGIDDEEVNIGYLLAGKHPSVLVRSPTPTSEIWNDIAITLCGNHLELCLDALRPSDAYYELEYVLGRLMRNLMSRLGQPVRYQILSFKDESGTEPRLPRTRVASVSFYDEPLLIKEFKSSIADLSLEDGQLDTALHYFEAGCRFFDEWSDLLKRRETFGKSEDGFEDTIWTSAFLQFWKAITSILDEPSKLARKNRIFAGRVVALGLGQGERRTLRALLDIRNDFDVSHRSYDRFLKALPRRNVLVVQQMARRVIAAYEKRLHAGKGAFGPHPFRVSRMRDEKRSPFKKVAETPKWRIVHFTMSMG